MYKKLTQEEFDTIMTEHKENPDTTFDLSFTDFSKIIIPTGCNLSNAYAEGAYFYNNTLSEVNFSNTIFDKAIFSACDVLGCNFTRANLHAAQIKYSYIEQTDFRFANCNGIFLTNNSCIKSNFESAKLEYACIDATDFSHTKLSKETWDYLRPTIVKSSRSLPYGIYAINNIGSRYDTTYYDAVHDYVHCGCWKSKTKQNTLKEFADRVEKVYGNTKNNLQYYMEYLGAVEFFERCRYLHKEQQRKDV